MADKFPFAFDLGAMKDMFKAPTFDMTAIQDAQQKNFAALVEANKTALAGYRALYQRQVELFENAVADTRTRFDAAQGKPVSIETAHENYETLKAAFEKAIADLKDMAEMANDANTQAFDIVKTRAEEALAEMKLAAEKMAA